MIASPCIYPSVSPTFSTLSHLIYMAFQLSFQSLSKFSTKLREKRTPSTNNLVHGFPFRCYISSSQNVSLSWSSSKSLSSISSSCRDELITEDEPSLGMTHTNELEFSRVNCLVWVLHESARSFSLAIQNLELSRTSPELSNAWNGVDVNAWHKRTAYQVIIIQTAECYIMIFIYPAFNSVVTYI